MDMMFRLRNLLVSEGITDPDGELMSFLGRLADTPRDGHNSVNVTNMKDNNGRDKNVDKNNANNNSNQCDLRLAFFIALSRISMALC